MLSTGLIAIFNGPASVIGVGRFMGEVMVTGCAIFTGAVTGVGRLTGVVSVNGEVIANGLVIVTGWPRLIGLEMLTALETLTGLLMFMAAATVTGLVIVPDATEEVILKGVERVTGVVAAVDVWHKLAASTTQGREKKPRVFPQPQSKSLNHHGILAGQPFEEARLPILLGSHLGCPRLSESLPTTAHSSFTFEVPFAYSLLCPSHKSKGSSANGRGGFADRQVNR